MRMLVGRRQPDLSSDTTVRLFEMVKSSEYVETTGKFFTCRALHLTNLQDILHLSSNVPYPYLVDSQGGRYTLYPSPFITFFPSRTTFLHN